MTSTSRHRKIKAADFDRQFDEGEVAEYLDLKSAKSRYPVQRVSIDFPKNILQAIDLEAAKIGVSRTALIKMWIAQQVSKGSCSS